MSFYVDQSRIVLYKRQLASSTYRFFCANIYSSQRSIPFNSFKCTQATITCAYYHPTSWTIDIIMHQARPPLAVSSCSFHWALVPPFASFLSSKKITGGHICNEGNAKRQPQSIGTGRWLEPKGQSVDGQASMENWTSNQVGEEPGNRLKEINYDCISGRKGPA